MKQKNVLALNINSDAFNAMKDDFNKILKRTLSNMELRESNVAELSVKLKIMLEKDEAPDYEITEYSATREVIKPMFSHKVSSVMQIKDSESGVLSGDYELVWDKEICDYVMKPIYDGQTRMFELETDDEEIDVDDGEEDEEIN